jgi:hypothetical protein
MPEIVRLCANMEGLRTLVADKFGIGAGVGNLWLPVVCTARGSLFAEVIGQYADGSYYQPVHLSDRQRQPLYRFAFELLDTLQAPPSVYLLQFAWGSDHQVIFDRLIPFPDKPAIASVGVQTPDLFECHWLCLTEQPIYDLVIYPLPNSSHPNRENQSKILRPVGRAS